MARTYRKSKYRKKSRDGIQPPRCYDPPCQICFPSKAYNRFLERYKAIQDASYDPYHLLDEVPDREAEIALKMAIKGNRPIIHVV